MGFVVLVGWLVGWVLIDRFCIFSFHWSIGNSLELVRKNIGAEKILVQKVFSC